MNRREAIDILTGLYCVPVENGADEFASEINKAIDMAIEALSDLDNRAGCCAGCKYEKMWSEACEKCGRPMVDNYVKESDTE